MRPVARRAGLYNAVSCKKIAGRDPNSQGRLQNKEDNFKRVDVVYGRRSTGWGSQQCLVKQSPLGKSHLRVALYADEAKESSLFEPVLYSED
jgi:hypothetical protein